MLCPTSNRRFVPNSDVTVPMENSVAYQLARNVPVPA
jgi:hypothetical protein